MYSLFNIRAEVNSRVSNPPNWNTIRTGLRQNLSRVISYYRRNPMAVESDHILVRLLQTIAIPKSLEITRYLDNVQSLATEVAMAMQFTNPASYGKVFDGDFYGKGSTEIILAHSTSFDLAEAHRNWENVAAVKVYRHAKSDLMLNIPNGKATSDETGIAVLAVNIPLLAIQYRAFRLAENEWAKMYGDSPRSIMQFVHMYVLPNMLFSHLDVAVFNRYNRLLHAEKCGQSKLKHSFHIVDYVDRMDHLQLSVLNQLSISDQSFSSIMQNIQLVTKEDLQDLMQLPKVVGTRQVTGAMTIACLDALDFVSSATDLTRTNMSEVNKLIRTIRGYRNNGIFRLLDSDTRNSVEAQLDNILAKIGA